MDDKVADVVEKAAPEKEAEKKPEIKIKVDDVAKDLKKKILSIYEESHKKIYGGGSGTLPKLVKEMKERLDAEHGVGWIVFSGQQYTGVCSHYAEMMLEFEVEGTIFTVFLPCSKPPATQAPAA